jgi:NtrC-family two-component system response regulator AlgB
VQNTELGGWSRIRGEAAQACAASPFIESRNPAVIALLDVAKRAAMGHTSILLTGESGSGKDVLARTIHNWSSQRDGPFIVVNCTALTDELLEREFSGHVRGAFTGAIKDKPGRLKAASGGTVFFDEIAELSNSIQSRLLRFVQEQALERIGDNQTVTQTITVDARIIAATRHDLEEEVAARRFREDLYYRLNVISMRLPPLRERIEDISDLAASMLEEIALQTNRAIRRLSPDAIDALLDYRWPGNIRELRNALERATALATADVIRLDDLPDKISRGVSPFAKSSNGTGLREREREYILRVLAESSSLDQAAEILGINVTTLWRKRKRYGLR